MKKTILAKYLCVSIFVLANHAAWSAQHEPVCANSKNTVEDTNCLIAEIDLKANKLQKYFSAAQRQEKYFGRTDEELIETQKIWDTYVNKHCGYIYSRQNGSARYRDSAECQLRLYDDRIYEIWIAYLTYYDSTAPVLPDPKK